jgi:DNA-binding transcriptional regulator YiaG
VHRDTHPAERSWCEDNDSMKGLLTISPADVTALRERLSYDWQSFARLINVSERTILALESGEKTAAGPLLRVLRILRLDSALADKLRPQLDH